MGAGASEYDITLGGGRGAGLLKNSKRIFDKN